MSADGKRALKLALVTSSYNYIADGVALTLNRLVGYLERQGVEVLVFAPIADRPAFVHQGTVVPVPSLPLPGRPEYRLALGMAGYVKRQLLDFQPDIIHIAVPDLLGHAALALANANGIPAVASYHTRYETYLRHYWYLALLEDFLTRTLRRFYGSCRDVYVPSDSVREALLADGLRDNFKPWPRGIDTARFTPTKRSTAWRARFGLGPDEVVILHVSRLVREKRLDTLTAALNRVTVPHRVLIVGDGPDRDLVEGKLPHAIFAGFLEGEDLATAYASADIFVFPSDSESFGNVTLEAMASGLPCVCADATGSRSLVVAGETGFLASADDAEGFARHIATLAQDGVLRWRMGEAARLRAQTFSWDETLAKMLGYYRALLAGTPEFEDFTVKIVDVCEFYSPTGGGVRRYINQKLALAGKFGHELTIIAPGAETRMEAARGGTIAWIKSPHLPFDRNYRMFWNHQQVWRTLDRLAPDLVEGSSPWRGGWLAARWPGKAVKVFFMHADPVAVYPQTFLGGLLGPERVDRLFGFFWRYLNRLNSKYDAAIVTNPALKERFSGFGLENIQVAPFGVERKNFSPDYFDSTARREMLATCGLGADAKLLIAVGRHHPEKRLRTLIQAVSRAQKRRKIGLYIVGDGFLRASVERWAQWTQHVYVAGQINDADQLATMMASADGLIHGSAAETFGLVLAEALCSGTPLIVPDAGASATFAGPGYAETYRAGDAADAAEAVLRLLAGDRAEQSRAALAAADAQVFTVEQHFERLFEIYERIVAERSTR